MKSYKIFAGIVFMLLIVSVTTSTAFAPRDEGFVEVFLYTHAEDRRNIEIGTTVDFSIVVKNLWNDTIHNMTLFQIFPAGSELMSIVNQPIEDQNQNFTDLSTTDERSGMQLDFNYINVTESNMTANFDINMERGDYFVFDFSLNFTIDGQYTLEEPSFTYYDHWGDRKTEAKIQTTTVEIVTIEQDTRTQFIPAFETTEPNYGILVGGIFAIFIIAILGRSLHLKKPIAT